MNLSSNDQCILNLVQIKHLTCKTHSFIVQKSSFQSNEHTFICSTCLSKLTITQIQPHDPKCTSHFNKTNSQFINCLKTDCAVTIFAFVVSNQELLCQTLTNKLPSQRQDTLTILKTYLKGALDKKSIPINTFNKRFLQIGGLDEWGGFLIENGFELVNQKLIPRDCVLKENIQESINDLNVLEYALKLLTGILL